MGASCFMIHYKLGQHKKTLFKWCLFAFLVIAIQWLIVTTCKSNLPRERFFHLKNNEGNFRPWYSLIWNKSNGSGFAYSSFPSGHTNWAIALILLCPLVYVISPKKPWLTITTTIFVAIIVITTMFARIQAARHYLSDTAMSVFISATCSTSIYLLFYKWNKFSVN
jgi:membrane-associated phospholipid phosphatase